MLFPEVICDIISEYAFEYKLKDCINPDDLIIDSLVKNKHATDYLIERYNYLRIKHLPIPIWLFIKMITLKVYNSRFTYIDFMLKKTTKLFTQENWDYLAEHITPFIYKIFLENPDKINWTIISKKDNFHAILLMKRYPNRINTSALSQNKSTYAIDILERNKHIIDWDLLCLNESPVAIKLLRSNLDKINWVCLSQNKSRQAIKLLCENKYKIRWDLFVMNSSPYAVLILEENINIIKKYPNSLMLNIHPNIKDIIIKHIEPKEYGQLLYNHSSWSIDMYIQYNLQKYKPDIVEKKTANDKYEQFQYIQLSGYKFRSVEHMIKRKTSENPGIFYNNKYIIKQILYHL